MVSNHVLFASSLSLHLLSHLSLSPSVSVHCTALAGSGIFFGSLLPLSWLGQALERATGWECGREARSEWRRRGGRVWECLGGGRLEGWRRGLTAGNEVFSFHPQKAESERTFPGSARLHSFLCLWSVPSAAALCAACASQRPPPAAERYKGTKTEKDRYSHEAFPCIGSTALLLR